LGFGRYFSAAVTNQSYAAIKIGALSSYFFITYSFLEKQTPSLSRIFTTSSDWAEYSLTL